MSRRPSASANNLYRDLDYSGYYVHAQKPNLIIVLLYIERKKNGSHVFASSLTASNTKRANLTRLPVTLSVLDMIIV